MHYEINYKGHATVADADRAAMKDIADWMGADRFARVDALYREMAEPVGIDVFRLQMSFAGIQGYPVEAWYRSLWPQQAAVDHAVDFQYHRIGHD